MNISEWIGISGIIVTILIALLSRKKKGKQKIRLIYEKTLRNESLGEPFIEVIGKSLDGDLKLKHPYLTSNLTIKNIGDMDFYLDQIEIQFISLGAKMKANKLTFANSELIQKGVSKEFSYKFDIREENVLVMITDCKMRFKVTEVSGEEFYSHYFRPAIEGFPDY